MQSAVLVASKFLELAAEEASCTGWQNDMTPMKLIKLVYIAHGYFLAAYDKPLISEDIEAWTYGPVIPELYSRIKNYGRKVVESIEDLEPGEHESRLSPEEKDHIKNIFDLYKEFSGPDLSNMTHKEGTPWRDIYERRYTIDSIVLTNDRIKDYYIRLLNG